MRALPGAEGLAQARQVIRRAATNSDVTIWTPACARAFHKVAVNYRSPPLSGPNDFSRVGDKADIFDCLFRPFADTATGDARMGGVFVDKSAGPARQWQVLLLGGPSGVGKTAVSYRLAHYFGVGITEV